MSISVVIPARDASATISSCLKAVAAALPKNSEVIVVDDGSRDDTAAIAAKAGARVISKSPSEGAAAARRTGAIEAKEKLIAFIDADIVIDQRALYKIEDYLGSCPDVDAVTGSLSTEHPNKNFWSQYKNLYMNYIFQKIPTDNVSFLYGSLFAVRSSVVSLMPLGIAFGEDTAFGLTLTRAGKQVHLVKDLLAVHLKRYSGWSFFRNDFRIPFHWGRLLTQRGHWRLVGHRGGGFAHASVAQLVSLVLSAGATTYLFFDWMASAVLMGGWFVLNARFLRFLVRHRGLGFALAAIPVTFADHLVMAVGGALGALRGLGGGR